ncbi:DNA binding domain, excisionase family [Meiothermus luteus]|uniref:DNA binding domain, excisionase family n=1 Tax=Meiothermus luteus TaxID=2026184 RepID=A0A399EV76_9DEIN|nr:DNA binding domain, excisionase family [Meiothermus luteus]
MQDNKKLAYSRREVAELLGIHLNTVDRYIRQGAIPARKLGNRWLIPAAALHAWLEGKDVQTPAGQGGER